MYFQIYQQILKKYLRRNLHFRKLFYIYEQNLWNTIVKKLFFSFYHTTGLFVIVLNAPPLK